MMKKTQFRVDLISISELSATHMCQELLLYGRVVKVWGPKKLPQFCEYICRECNSPECISVKYPYESIIHPKCTVCGNTKMESLPPKGELLTWCKIHLRDQMTHFILELIGYSDVPIKGQIISFRSSPIPRIKNKKITISTWRGETESFQILS